MSSFNFLDLDAFVTGVPHGALAQLRRDSPVFWHQMTVNHRPDGFWLVTKHADIVEISKDPTLFYSNAGSVLTDAPPAVGPLKMVRDGFCHLDRPLHTTYRNMIMPLFAARAISALEQRIRERVAETLDRAALLRELDLVTEVAELFPATVVYGDVLGMPDDDVINRGIYWGDLFNRVHSVMPGDPEYGEIRASAAEALVDMHGYALDALRERRENPGEDVLSVLAVMKTPDGNEISEDQFLSYVWSLETGAYDTTASTIAGGWLALEQYPEQRTRLYADPSLAPSAVEEMLRWETPVIYFRRTASADTEIRGCSIKRGQRIAMCYAAANRDEDVFANPDVFDITRRPNDHLAFGHGAHFCLGARLARTEIRLLLEEMVRRRVRFELRGDVVRTRSNFMNRIKQMPVALVPA